jgi:hypothetical protein
MAFSLADLNDLIATRNFSELVGKVENEWFDAKDQPYDVDENDGKREIAKDVAAFANKSGGLIIIGLRTNKSTQHFGDEVVKVRPIEQNRIDSGRYRDILAAWIFPPVVGIQFEWLATRDDVSRGLFVIRIPPQAEELLPFLVVRTVESGKVVETFFGYAERRGEVNAPLGIVDLQRALRTGLNFERHLDQRLSAIEANLSNAPSRSNNSDQERQEKLKTRMSSAVAASDFAEDRALVLAARPSTDNDLQTIFSARDDSIRRKVERPPIFRDHGWDLVTGGYAQIIRGEMIRISGFRKIIDLYRDGTLVFACAANEDFLSWTSKVEQMQIHSMALIEICYNFAVLYKLVLADLQRPLAKVEFAAGLRRFHLGGVKTKLAAFGYGSFSQLFPDHVREAPDNDATITTTFPVSDYVAGRVAFTVAREIYLWFGLDEDKIPYTSAANGDRYIDPDLLSHA